MMKINCNKISKNTTVTLKRCNEMIKGFEDQINHMFKTNVKYKGEERKLLIKTIKDNPTHCWEVTNTGLIHYPLDVLPKKIICDLINQAPTGEKK